MRRQRRLTTFCLPFALALLLAAAGQPLASLAQDGAEPTTTEVSTRPKRVRPGEEGLLLFALVNRVPAEPALLRLLRIVLRPGATSPLHVHPGPEVGVVESGVSTVLVEGPSDLLPAGRTKPIPAPEGEAFEMERGDQIVYREESPQQFTNAGDDDTVILSVVVLPAGSQHPPGLTWVNGTPGPNALAGVTSSVLGDGVASQLPDGPAAIVVERLVLDPGENIPATDVPTLLSVEDGKFDFTTVEGDTQVSRNATPGPQPAAEIGEEFSLAPGDAAFFPGGIVEVERPDADGRLSLLRLTIVAVPSGDAGTSTASPVASPIAGTAPAQGPSVIEIIAAPEPAPPATEDVESGESTGAAEDATEPATDDGTLGIGDDVVINETEVRLRDAPTTDSSIVTGLDQGAEFTITDGPVEADGIIWYAIQSNIDPAVVGWVAGDFLDPA